MASILYEIDKSPDAPCKTCVDGKLTTTTIYKSYEASVSLDCAVAPCKGEHTGIAEIKDVIE